MNSILKVLNFCIMLNLLTYYLINFTDYIDDKNLGFDNKVITNILVIILTTSTFISTIIAPITFLGFIYEIIVINIIFSLKYDENYILINNIFNFVICVILSYFSIFKTLYIDKSLYILKYYIVFCFCSFVVFFI